MIEGKKILVTGGTGSIGKFVVERLLNADAEKVVVLGRTESKHDKLLQIIHKRHHYRLECRIGDVRNYQTVIDAMSGCDSVFHIAAMKYVPACEENVIEAVRTNILGAQNIRDACVNSGVSKVVVVSTDKAAEPRGIMGMTKYIQERLFVNPAMPKTKVVTTRFGNVLGSEGSVVWKFKDQGDKNENITLTSEKMCRFVMTPNQAAELVVWAGMFGNDGDIVIRDMPLCRIIDLAKVIAPNSVIEITGVRPGEKLDETLLNLDEEPYARMATDDIIVVNKRPSQDLPVFQGRVTRMPRFLTERNLIQMMMDIGVL